MKTAIQIGLSIAEWEEMTPYELYLSCESYVEVKEAEIQQALTITWLGEYYHRLKRLPSLKETLKQFEPKKEMTSDQMLEMAKMLNAQFGGTVRTKDGE